MSRAVSSKMAGRSFSGSNESLRYANDKQIAEFARIHTWRTRETSTANLPRFAVRQPIAAILIIVIGAVRAICVRRLPPVFHFVNGCRATRLFKSLAEDFFL